MAKKQTRRSLSLSRSTYDAVTRAAAEAGVSGSEWVTRLIRERIHYLPEQIHVRPASEGQPSHTVGPQSPRLTVHVPNATHEPPKPRPVIVVPQRDQSIPSGTLCANCVEHPAVTRGRVDVAGPEYPLCRACVLPNDRVEDGRGRWKRKPGTIRENQIADELGEP